jgi:VanZ family protein
MRSLTLLARVAFAAACLVTLVAALTPPDQHPLQVLPWEKANHVLAFAVLAILGVVAAPKLPLPALCLLLVGLGGLIELMQALPMVRRDPSVRDVAIDTAAVLAVLAPIGLARWRARADGAPLYPALNWTRRAPADPTPPG